MPITVDNIFTQIKKKLGWWMRRDPTIQFRGSSERRLISLNAAVELMIRSLPRHVGVLTPACYRKRFCTDRLSPAPRAWFVLFGQFPGAASLHARLYAATLFAG